MSEINGVRFGKRDRQGKIRVILPKNAEININGVTAVLKSSATVIVESHEDANNLLGSGSEKSEEGLDSVEE